MDDGRTRLVAAAAGTFGLFVAIQLGALALVSPFEGAGYQAVEDPSDPTNSFLYLGVILVFTAMILGILKLGVDRALRVIVTGACGMLAFYVFSVLVPAIVPGTGPLVAVGLAAAVAIALYVHPEWYVIDATGVIVGAGGAGLFGISFGPLPAILLLGALAVYDAVSVYGTEHMLALAEGATDLKLPLVLIVPLSAGYSYLEDDAVADGDQGEREAFFIGLGDAVMPTIMVASAAFFIDAPSFDLPVIAMNLPALTAMIGTLLGLGGLLFLVAKGRAHAGLPLLNGGAVGGYVLGAVLAGVPLVEAIGIAGYL